MFIAEIIAHNRGINDGITGKNNWDFEDEMMNLAYLMGKEMSKTHTSYTYITCERARIGTLHRILILGEESKIKAKTNLVSDGYEGYLYINEGFENILARSLRRFSTKRDALDWAEGFKLYLINLEKANIMDMIF